MRWPRRAGGGAEPPPVAARRASCAPPPPLPPSPDDFHFTCKQPGCGGAGGSAALRGTAVTAAAPCPPRPAGGAGPRRAAQRPLVPPGTGANPALGGAVAPGGVGRKDVWGAKDRPKSFRGCGGSAAPVRIRPPPRIRPCTAG